MTTPVCSWHARVRNSRIRGSVHRALGDGGVMPLQPPDDPSGRLAGVAHDPGHAPESWQALGRVLPDYDGRRGRLREMVVRVWVGW